MSTHNCPLVCECKECGTILEAPLMSDANPCCVESVKNLALEFLKKTWRASTGEEPTMLELIPYMIIIDQTLGDGGGEDDGEEK